MKVLICNDAESATTRASNIAIATVEAHPKSVLGLATGGTMIPFGCPYRAKQLRLSGCTTFNLDEYIGLAPEHPCSYHSYMRSLLLGHVDLDASRTHLPRGDSADPIAESQRYEALIESSGGIDSQLLGIGQNGHIGQRQAFARAPGSKRSRKARVMRMRVTLIAPKTFR